MNNEKVYAMPVSKVYPLLVAKAQRKGRSKEEVDEVTMWLTGFSKEKLYELIDNNVSYRDFFEQASLNPKSELIKGSICGIKIEEIEDPLMKKIRYLDKLVDELSKGKAMDKILRR